MKYAMHQTKKRSKIRPLARCCFIVLVCVLLRFVLQEAQIGNLAADLITTSMVLFGTWFLFSSHSPN